MSDTHPSISTHHEPAIYDRDSGELTIFNFGKDWYLDNLALERPVMVHDLPGDARRFVFDCPWCGGTHTHSPEYGHRVSHCHAPGAPRGYVRNWRRRCHKW